MVNFELRIIDRCNGSFQILVLTSTNYKTEIEVL